MTKPQRRHHVLPDQGGKDVMETLCNILIVPQRGDDEKITSFKTVAGNPIQIMFDDRGVSCSTCQYVWRNIKGTVHG